MITDLGRRHAHRMRERVTAFEAADLPLHRLIADLEGLAGLLRDEADPDWVDELEEACNRLEFVNAAALQEQRDLTPDEHEEVADALRELQALLKDY